MTANRALHKAWQDKRPGFTHRVRWYEGPGLSIRLCFQTPQGRVNLFYQSAEEAQQDYDAFARGELGFWEMMEKKG